MAGEIERLDFRIEDWAGRDRAWEWMGYEQILPDPDQVMERKGYSTYEWIKVLEHLLTDPHVWSCYQGRKSGTLSQKWEIAEGEGPKSKEALELVEGWLKTQKVHQTIEQILDAPFFGMQPMEVIWKAEGGRWLPARVVDRPVEWFVFDLENRLRFLSKGNMIQGELPPEYKILLTQHSASYKNPYGQRVLSRCFWPMIWKRSGQKFWAIFAEKYGMPWLIGKVPKGTLETERVAILAKLVQMVQDAVAVINDDEAIEIKSDPFKASAKDIFGGLANNADTQISKAILGQTLTTEPGESGSYSLGQVHADVRQDLVEQDMRLVAETFDLLFQWITELNFAGAAAPTWGWHEEEDVQEDRAKRDETLNRQGVRFSKDYYKRTYNLEETDFEVNVPASADPVEASADQSGQVAGQQDGAAAKTEFREKGKTENPAEVIDLIAQKALDGANHDELIDPVKALLDEVQSLEEFKDRLGPLFAGLEPVKMEVRMERALALAELAGRFDGRLRD